MCIWNRKLTCTWCDCPMRGLRSVVRCVYDEVTYKLDSDGEDGNKCSFCLQLSPVFQMYWFQSFVALMCGYVWPISPDTIKPSQTMTIFSFCSWWYSVLTGDDRSGSVPVYGRDVNVIPSEASKRDSSAPGSSKVMRVMCISWYSQQLYFCILSLEFRIQRGLTYTWNSHKFHLYPTEQLRESNP